MEKLLNGHTRIYLGAWKSMSSSSYYYSSGESLNLRYEALKCDCGLRAAIRVTESDKPSKGRLYFICEKRNCQFWRWCTPKSVTMVERLRNERMLDQNQNMETVGLKVKNQMFEQSNAFMKQLAMGLLTICILHYSSNDDKCRLEIPGVFVLIISTQEETQSENRKDKEKSSQRYPDATKFRHMPLQFAEDFDILFLEAAATREWAYTPSSGVMPQTDKTPEEFHTPHDAEFHDDSDLEVVHSFESNKKQSSNTDGSSTKSKTKNKFTGAALLNKTLDRIVNVVESSSATSTQTSPRYPSITECLAKLESIPGVSPGDELYTKYGLETGRKVSVQEQFRDIAFDSYDRFTDYVPNEEKGSSSQQVRHGNDVDCDDNEMEVRRHNICMAIYRRN
ncbi:hypothetical protein HYC85_008806 [Camellia sinensis]|uniref:GRF-type domain-containing protein n=1 Tax=Camellia sinensis TaxID=4442 RepID=A0A7J7HSX9_CAMSI|nr:hypothetical protein HYC85_008806 [Camellia sinensis]